MSVLADTGGILALMTEADPRHAEVRGKDTLQVVAPFLGALVCTDIAFLGAR